MSLHNLSPFPSFDKDHSIHISVCNAEPDTYSSTKDHAVRLHASEGVLQLTRCVLVVVTRAAVGIGNRVWGNETVMTFLKTGIFNYWVPLGGVIHWEVLPCSSLVHLPILLPATSAKAL